MFQTFCFFLYFKVLGVEAMKHELKKWMDARVPFFLFKFAETFILRLRSERQISLNRRKDRHWTSRERFESCTGEEKQSRMTNSWFISSSSFETSLNVNLLSGL